jgi:hypothetical protein
MTTRLPMALEDLRIATPCSADWDEMSGDARVRFCGSCEKNVYNLSAMTRAEAEALVREREGRICVRLFQRRDGTVITSDCPVALERQRLHRRVWAKLTGIGASAALVLGLFGGRARGDLTIKDGKNGTAATPVRAFMGAAPPPAEWMGKMAEPHATPPKKTGQPGHTMGHVHRALPPVHAVEKKGKPMAYMGDISAPRTK